MSASLTKAKQSLFQSGVAFGIILFIGIGLASFQKAIGNDDIKSEIKLQKTLEQKRVKELANIERLAKPYNAVAIQLAPSEGGQPIYADETASRLPVDQDDSRGVAVGDVDGDGDLDIIIANKTLDDADGNDIPGSGQNKLYINDSTGNFVDETSSRFPGGDFYSLDVAFGDVDQDGDLDIFVANWFDPDRLLINDGQGHFSDETSNRLPTETTDRALGEDAEFGDLDNDGDFDIVVANWLSQRNRLLINNGSGVFSDESDSRLPLDSDSSEDLDLGDLDNDGDLDIIVANGVDGEQNRLLINGGDATFTDETSLRLPSILNVTNNIAFIDVEADGDLDVFFANFNEESRLLINDGTGKFSDETANRLPVGTDFNKDVAFSDVDNDGDLDLFLTDVGQDELLINDGVGIFTLSEFPVEDNFGSDAEFADFNSDGNPDLVVANIVLGVGDDDPQTRLYINTLPPVHAPVDSQTTSAVTTPTTLPADGISLSTITVTPKDAAGNNLGPGQRVVMRSTAGTLLERVSDKGNGAYTQSLQSSSVAGQAVVTVFVNGVQIKQTPQIAFTN